MIRSVNDAAAFGFGQRIFASRLFNAVFWNQVRSLIRRWL
jgi:hypothetical protein